jgi:hypothetical protein
MTYKIDLSNAAYSPEYINYRYKIINKVYDQKNKTNEEIFEYENFKKIIEYYPAKDKEYCAKIKIYSRNNKLLHEYFNVYDQNLFCEYIKYNNGLDYIFYKEDLYGYSVFEVNTKKVFNYYPLATFNEVAETFIGTNIHYNVHNNIFAVEGCYWACPWDIFLFKLDNPMERFTEILNIRELIDPGYKKYNNIDFVGWENNNIKLKSKTNEIILSEGEYKNKLNIL